MGKYQVIVCDPPWQYDFSKSKNRKVENHYSTMSLDAIQALSIGLLADSAGCVLYLWSTSPKLPQALATMAAWGFEYKTCAVWDKQRMGMGYYFRQEHELLLIGTYGNRAVLADPALRVGSLLTPTTFLIASPRTRHSAKPDLTFAVLNQMYPTQRKLELFARTQRPGWDCWGDEVASSIEMPSASATY